MTDSFPKRVEGVGKEAFVVIKADEGHVVYAPAKPKESYLVRGVPGQPTCTCSESDSQEKCRHILAVEQIVNRTAAASKVSSGEALREKNETQAPGNGSVSPQMILKRSVSPDGRIDALSVEFSISVEKLSVSEIRNLAQRSLAIQSQIVGSFLTPKGNENGRVSVENPESNGTVPAQIIGVEAMPTKWGRRLYLIFMVNGEEVRLFGSPKRLGNALVLAGYPNVVRDLSEGLKVSLPCRVTVSPSQDGRYMRIQQIFPAVQRGARQ